jgi:membrane-bound lytic murein transglycosylase B
MAFEHAPTQPSPELLTKRLRPWRKLAMAGALVLPLTGLVACDPDGPGSLPDIPIDFEAHPFRAASTSEPQTDAQRWHEAENNYNVAKYMHYRQMLDAMNKFAAKRGTELQDPGWMFEIYERAQRVSGVPMEIILGVNGIETTFSGFFNDGGACSGPMQMTDRAFSTYVAGLDFPVEIYGPKDVTNPHWAIPAAARMLAANGARPGDSHGTEMALRIYNSGSTRGGIDYAHTVMGIARDAGWTG